MHPLLNQHFLPINCQKSEKDAKKPTIQLNIQSDILIDNECIDPFDPFSESLVVKEPSNLDDRVLKPGT